MKMIQLPRFFYKYLYYVPYSKLNILCRKATHFYILNSLICGGAELETINYIRAIKKLNPSAKIAIITTSNQKSTWAFKVKKYAKVVPFGEKFSHLPLIIQFKIIASLIIDNKPRIIHLNNSSLGYEFFMYYSDQISKISKIFVSVFCNIITPSKEVIGWPITHLPKFINKVTGVFSDNATYLHYLEKRFNFKHTILSCHYQPVLQKSSIFYSKNDYNILWAGRLDKQKRPDLLIKIAKKALGTKLRFHVHGGPVIDETSYVNKLTQLPNVIYHGPYNSFEELPTKMYAMFLYTSEYDGIPNVVLEAMASGLPVVASDVGGLHEIIKHGKTGILIKPFTDINKYVTSLQKLSSSSTLRYMMGKNALKKIQLTHTYDSFLSVLKKEKSYINYD